MGKKITRSNRKGKSLFISRRLSLEFRQILTKIWIEAEEWKPGTWQADDGNKELINSSLFEEIFVDVIDE